MSARGGGLSRYRSSHDASTAYTLVGGPQSLAALTAAGHVMVTMGPPSAKCPRLRAAPFGTGADNSTFDYKVWRGCKVNGAPDLCRLTLAGSGTVTLGTAVGTATNAAVFGPSDRAGDTLTWTASALFTALGTAINAGAAAYSPADNTQAELVISDLGDADFVIIETDLTGATGANWLVSPFE